MSVAPAEANLQHRMQLGLGGLLGNPQSPSHRWGHPQPHAQLHRADFTAVDHTQTLPLISINRHCESAITT